MDQGIQADDIHSAEGGGFRPSNDRSCKFIHFFNGHAQILYRMKKTLDAENTDSVTDKSRGILGNHRGFT